MTTVASKTLAKKIVKIIWSKKAEDVVLLDLKKLSSITDYFLICSAGSNVHAQTIADAVLEGLDSSGVLSHIEGYETGHWILIDCYGVVLHIFRPDIREYYGLERLWGDAPREEFPDED